MSLTVSKIEVWAAQIEDKPGGLAKLLGHLLARAPTWSA